jgi:hypothetical protein
MQGTTGARPQGSFGIPPQMQQDLEEQRRRAAQAKPAERPVMAAEVPIVPAVALPEAPEVVKTKEDEEAKQEEEFKRLKASIEKRLETTITAEDIKEYIFKGALTKEVSVIPGILKCAFRTLTPTEYFEIDKREATFRDEGKFTVDGISNHRAIVTLSYAWIAADGKPISSANDPLIREKHIRKLGAHVVDFATAANQNFNDLLKLTLQEKAFLKKS